MKIGIVTIINVNNYGANLQAFALQRKLLDMGYNSEVINYPFYKSPLHKKTAEDKPLFNIGLQNKIKEFLFPLWKGLSEYPNRNKLNIRQLRMEMFQHEHIRMSPKLYFSLKDLNQENHPYDVFIVGSDQVWNPRMNASMDPYFLSFVQPGKRRIAYGASFGVSNFSDEVKKVIKGQLDKFDAISMRETSGVQLVESLTGREAFPVVDPTLLLDESEWSQVSVPPSVKGDYILIYELKYSRQLTRMATQLAIKLGIKKIIRLCGDGWQSRSNEVEDVLDAGPAEFVGLFQRASFVITNSLHGTLFSIIFRKPFYYVNPQGSQNSGRISELLELTGLEDRYIEERDVAKEESILKIDYRETALRLKQMKVDSLAYLQRAIGL